MKVEAMRAKLTTAICALAVILGGVASSSASADSGPLTVATDFVVIRPACLAATLVGSAFFVVSLPVAAMSKSVKTTADTLVVKPAKATFTRPLGDVKALTED